MLYHSIKQPLRSPSERAVLGQGEHCLDTAHYLFYTFCTCIIQRLKSILDFSEGMPYKYFSMAYWNNYEAFIESLYYPLNKVFMKVCIRKLDRGWVQRLKSAE